MMLELEMSIRGVEVTRTLRVPSSFTFADLHSAIQIAFGWSNSEMHEFTIGSDTYGAPEIGSWGRTKDETHYKLGDLLRKKSKCTYEYHRQDGWHHEITVTKAEETEDELRCTHGSGASPREGCGGPASYKKGAAFEISKVNRELGKLLKRIQDRS